MAAPIPLLAVNGVTKVFANGVTALSRVSMSLAAGECVTLLGPSGCGKSTLLRILAGLTAPTEGDVSWPDRADRDHRHEIGFVFQEPTLMPWADVADNVWLPLRLRGIPRSKAKERIEECLARVGLEDFAGAYPRELSGGMKMRASIARALVLRPRLLLMDEPFGALDEIARFRLNDDLLRLKRELGCAVVFVTHSVFESVYLADRVLVMSPRPGAIVAEVAVDAPRERGLGFRTSETYAAQCGRVSRILAEAMPGEEA
ncbi:ABC transporter ATP-binding protein [Microvirga thermotolerans]|uniref:ATP-binding cassette domain-containing protein n=1 Tax=Microvirga thermotolerans TaxID=2651334 RepID=A0A5P9JRK6_9HYPH|nr:ABC transporter ATP-binding protein [Microvirga thermotolerans]QFU15382.1 ATP-binding cassette domain-containing protein [Microvirga thermotolerans]